MDSDKLASMMAEIGCHKPKERSGFRNEPGFSEKWDTVSAQMAAQRELPGFVGFNIPHEIQ